MIKTAWNWIAAAERRLMRSFGKDISTPWNRFLSRVHMALFDHGILRGLWTNFYKVAPGVFRSNHPTDRRFRQFKAMGIKTVINLRGPDKFSFYLFEREICDELGLTLVDAKLWARLAPSTKKILAAIDAIRQAEKPLVFHCKSGADRTGFLAAVYLIVFEGATPAEARKHLGLRYMHLKFTKTGIQDYIIDVYEARLALGPIGFEDWVRDEYRAARLQDGFDRKIPPSELAHPE